jgi:hypothetical protein
MPTGLDLFRPSAFLRSSDTQPEEKFVHRAICFLAEFGMTFVGGVVRAPNIDDWTPVVLRSSTAEQHCDRVIDQAADLKSSSCMAVIISSHRRTVAMMNSIHSLLSENHPCTYSWPASFRLPEPNTLPHPPNERGASAVPPRVQGSSHRDALRQRRCRTIILRRRVALGCDVQATANGKRCRPH